MTNSALHQGGLWEAAERRIPLPPPLGGPEKVIGKGGIEKLELVESCELVGNGRREDWMWGNCKRKVKSERIGCLEGIIRRAEEVNDK